MKVVQRLAALEGRASKTPVPLPIDSIALYLELAEPNRVGLPRWVLTPTSKNLKNFLDACDNSHSCSATPKSRVSTRSIPPEVIPTQPCLRLWMFL